MFVESRFCIMIYSMLHSSTYEPFAVCDVHTQLNMPFFPRKRINVFGNHDLLMKAEFLFFWTPTFIIWSLTSESLFSQGL